MSEIDDKKKKRDEEFESILDIIDPHVKINLNLNFLIFLKIWSKMMI